jgi:hypothetical protein
MKVIIVGGVAGGASCAALVEWPAGHHVRHVCAGWMKKLKYSWWNADRMFRMQTVGYHTMWEA